MDIRLPAEWESQSMIQLTFPHVHTDWVDILDEAINCFVTITRTITRYQRVLLVHHPTQKVAHFFSEKEQENIIFIAADSNDTWARDHAPLTIFKNGKPVLLNFQFNGWGLKFAADKDNLLNIKLYQKGVFSPLIMRTLNFVLEGGSLESDGAGTILTTSNCLLSPNRNPEYDRVKIEQHLIDYFDAKRILWLENGHLIGDDTDAHIDTLARFCDKETITYVQCKDTNDPHFASLQKMEIELQSFKTLTGESYRLIPLPLPTAIYNKNGDRLPATYANFLIINKAVLLPIYGVKEDEMAILQLKKCFPHRAIIPIHCRTLITQNGSLHCVTMQHYNK